MDRDSTSLLELRYLRCLSAACHTLTGEGPSGAPRCSDGGCLGLASPLTLPHSQTDLTPNLRIAHGDEFIVPQLGLFQLAKPIFRSEDEREMNLQ